MSTARENLTPDQIHEFERCFEMFDEDGGGDISTTELGKVMSFLGWNPTLNELKDIIRDVDVEGKPIKIMISHVDYRKQPLLILFFKEREPSI